MLPVNMNLNQSNQEMEDIIQSKMQDMEKYKEKIAILKQQLVEKQKIKEGKAKEDEEIFQKLTQWKKLACKISKITGLDCSQPRLLEKALLTLKNKRDLEIEKQSQLDRQFGCEDSNKTNLEQVDKQIETFKQVLNTQTVFVGEKQTKALQHCYNQFEKFEIILQNHYKGCREMPKDNQKTENLKQLVKLYGQCIDKLEDECDDGWMHKYENIPVDAEHLQSSVEKEISKLELENNKLEKENADWCTKSLNAINLYVKNIIPKQS